MKKYLLLGALMIAVLTGIKAQQTKLIAANHYTDLKPSVVPVNNSFSKNSYLTGNNDPEKDADFYFRKSKSQRTIGWVTLGAGIVLSGVGLLIASNSNPSIDMYGNITDDNSSAGAVLAIVGAASGITSIPFMIMAHANKNKAKLMLANQKTGFGVPSKAGRHLTCISLVIPIGR